MSQEPLSSGSEPLASRVEEIKLEVSDRLATITFDRPDKLNALSWPMANEFQRILKAAERDPAVRVIIVKGAGRCFSSGYDLKETSPAVLGPGVGPSDGEHEPRGVKAFGRGIWNSRAHVQDHINFDMLIWNLWKPVIAQVHGFAYGGASTMALSCDLTIMASDARIGYPPTRWLATGDNVGIYSFLAGLKKAREMSYGRTFDGVESVACGLANYHFPEAELEAQAREIAERIATIDSELLMLNKMVVNRTWEIQGYRTAAEVAGEFDSICHLANTAKPLSDAIHEADGNLAAALAKLNKPWAGM